MYYSKVETYMFDIPREYRAYLDFKEELRASGVRFLDEGGSTHQLITIRTNGTFDKTEEVE